MKVLYFISNLVFPTIYADGFFDDYPDIAPTNVITGTVANKATEVFGNWFVIVKWAWLFALIYSIIAFTISIVRLAIHSEDNPMKREGYRHDLFQSLILFAILGGTPLVFSLILNLLNGRFF